MAKVKSSRIIKQEKTVPHSYNLRSKKIKVNKEQENKLLIKIPLSDLTPPTSAQETVTLYSQEDLKEFNKGHMKATALDLGRKLTKQDVCSILNNPLMSLVTSLKISFIPLGDDGFKVLAYNPYLSGLKEFKLNLGGITFNSIALMAFSETFNNLEHLEITNCPKVGYLGAKYLSTAKFFGNLKHLSLNSCLIGDEGLAELCKKRVFTPGSLSVRGCALTVDCESTFKKSVMYKRVNFLDMMGNNLADLVGCLKNTNLVLPIQSMMFSKFIEFLYIIKIF